MPNPYNYNAPNMAYFYRPPEPPAHPPAPSYPMPAAPMPRTVPLPPLYSNMPAHSPYPVAYHQPPSHPIYSNMPPAPPPPPKPMPRTIPLPVIPDSRAYHAQLHPLAQQETRRNPASSSNTRAPAPPPAQSSSRPRANTIAAAPPRLDVRGNDIEATQRESRWAVQLWSHLTPQQAQPFVAHLHQIIATVRASENRFPHMASKIDKKSAADYQKGFSKASSLERELKEWVRTGGDGAELASRLQGYIKQTIDLLGFVMDSQSPAVSNTLRAQPFFTDRGRQKLRTEQIRSSSRDNKHAGIADTLNRRRSTENFFPQRINHAKSSNARVATSDTARRFQASGTPFIAGASGTAQFIIGHLEAQRPFAQCSPPERQSREMLLVMYTALMTLSGHHSVMESLIVGRRLGYFADLPDPLQGPGSYNTSMRALDARLRKMGLDANVRMRA